MSGFAFRPKVKDFDYYMDVLTDVINNEVGDAHVPLLDYLREEQDAADANNETATSEFIFRIRRHLLSRKS